MHLIGAVDIATCDTSQPVGGANCTPFLSRAYSKNADWPTTTITPGLEDIFNTGCYESGVNPSQFVTGQVMPGCFRVVDVKDPKNPVRVAEVPTFDPVNSPLPPSPNSSFWTSANANLNVWTNAAFNGQDCTILDGNVLASCTKPFGLTISTACGDWKIESNGKYHAVNVGKATCWDKGWITRTHYSAGADGAFKHPDFDFGFGHNEFIYWVNSQRQGGAPTTRPSYTGISFYDLREPHDPKFLSRIEATVHIYTNGTYSNAVDIDCSGGVHHGFFDGRFAYTGWCEYGYTGDTLTMIDAKDPVHPKFASRWVVPGQNNNDLAIRNSTAIDPKTGLEMGWKPVAGFTPVTRDVTKCVATPTAPCLGSSNPNPTGLLQKDVSMHYISVYPIDDRVIGTCSWHDAGIIILDLTDRYDPKFISRFDYLTPNYQANDQTGPIEPITGLPWAQVDHKVCQETWAHPTTWTNSGIDPGEAAAGRIACGYTHSGKFVPGTNYSIRWETDEYFTVPYGHLRIMDYSNLKHPKFLAHWFAPPRTYPPSTDNTTYKVNGIQIYSRNWSAISENFALVQDYPKRTASSHLGNAYDPHLLFLAWYGSGVFGIDISNPSHPKLAGAYPFIIQDSSPTTGPNGIRQGGAATYDVIFDHRGHLVVTDSNDGVRILKYTGPGAPLYTGPGTPALNFEGYGKDWFEGYDKDRKDWDDPWDRR
jgi:hypothetical protein